MYIIKKGDQEAEGSSKLISLPQIDCKWTGSQTDLQHLVRGDVCLSQLSLPSLIEEVVRTETPNEDVPRDTFDAAKLERILDLFMTMPIITYWCSITLPRQLNRAWLESWCNKYEKLEFAEE